MAITKDDFEKVWASTSPLTPYAFSDAQYKEGWNFIGSTPPSRQMWDFLQKNNDEKMQYLANNYLPLSGGTLTGVVNGVTPTADDNSTKIATTAWIENIFLNKLVAKLAASAATSISSLNTSSLFYRMLSWALTASGVSYNIADNGYVCLGSFFGGLIIQWGIVTTNNGNGTMVLPISANNLISVLQHSGASAQYNGIRVDTGKVVSSINKGADDMYFIAITTPANN